MPDTSGPRATDFGAADAAAAGWVVVAADEVDVAGELVGTDDDGAAEIGGDVDDLAADVDDLEADAAEAAGAAGPPSPRCDAATTGMTSNAASPSDAAT